MTDFENAALIVALNMILNVINQYDVNFIMPISMIDENMEKAHRREGLIRQKFWFRTNTIPQDHDFKTLNESKKNNLKESNWTRSNN